MNIPAGDIDVAYLLDTLRTLVGIDSILPHEERLAEFVANELRSMGVEPEWQEVAPGRPNVYATAGLGSVDRFLVFSGHSDTVGIAEGWQTDPFNLTEKNGRLYGLGTYNMKAGLACSLAAFKALVTARFPHGQSGRLGFAMTVDQEGHSIGARALLNTDFGRCDAMLHAEHFYGDSSDDYLPNAATGKVLYKLTVKGRAAHANRPNEGGINAITDASHIVASLDRLRLRDHSVLGKGTVCVLKIAGGYREYAMVVPECCELVITRLTIPGETRDVAVSDMKDLVDSLQLQSAVTIETPPPCYEPYFLDEQSPIVTLFRQVYTEVIGQTPHFAGHRGVVDANIFNGEAGIPTVVFGPKGANHHRAGEYVELSSLAGVAQVYALSAWRFMSGDPFANRCKN